MGLACKVPCRGRWSLFRPSGIGLIFTPTYTALSPTAVFCPTAGFYVLPKIDVKKLSLSSFNWKEVYFGMLTACFDASGTVHDKPYLIVAGYLGSADDWVSFDKQWAQRLPEGIAYFRRSECATNTGQFVGWDKKPTEKDELLRDLIGIIDSTTIRKTGCIIANAILKESLSPEIETQFHLHAYAFGGIVSVSEFYKWRHGRQIAAPLEYIFERGDDGANELRKVMDIFGTPDPIFRAKVETKDRKGNPILAFTGLQAADFLAWEMSQLIKGTPTEYLELLDKKDGDPTLLTVDTINDFDDLFRQVATDDEFAKKISEKQKQPLRQRVSQDKD